MSSLQNSLKDFFKEATAIAILGIGSEMRADDAVGMLIAEYLQIYTDKASAKCRYKIIYGGTAPENFTGDIRKFKPTHLLMIDAAEMGKEPGYTEFLLKEKIGNHSFSTHKMPINVMIDYLAHDLDCKFGIIGVQPKIIEFGKPPTDIIKKAASDIASLIEDILEGK
jgi:hydrogenase 3 maturation protease